MSVDSLSSHPLGKTAQYVAACRAVESNKRPDQNRKFYDPWADEFAGPGARQVLVETVQRTGKTLDEVVKTVTARTCFIDDFFMRTVSQQAPEACQCVILAVGGDARPYRLDLPEGTVIYEIDFPEVMEYRASVFGTASALCEVRSVGADLTCEDWVTKLTSAGFDPSKKSIWLLEGILMYPSAQEGKKLMTQISNLCQPGSMICCDIIPSLMANYIPKGHGAVRVQPDLWAKFGAEVPKTGMDNPESYFSELGFKTWISGISDVIAKYGLGKKETIEKGPGGVLAQYSLLEGTKE